MEVHLLMDRGFSSGMKLLGTWIYKKLIEGSTKALYKTLMSSIEQILLLSETQSQLKWSNKDNSYL